MENKDIQKLLDFIAQSGLDEVQIETSELKLAVKRYGQPVAAAAYTPVAAPSAAPQAAPAAAVPAPETPSAPQQPAAGAATGLITVRSPMIGTFYRSSSPETPPFVEVGTEVKPGKVLCVVEAMKLFNEIEAEVAGRVVQVLVENATPIEFDQPLFLVEPL